jgi:hypothetical protein
MPLPELLTARIRGEYREMPGLRLTFAQACRLWQMDAVACATVLETLVAEHFLVQTANGAYMALPSIARPRTGPAPLAERTNDAASTPELGITARKGSGAIELLSRPRAS